MRETNVSVVIVHHVVVGLGVWIVALRGIKTAGLHFLLFRVEFRVVLLVNRELCVLVIRSVLKWLGSSLSMSEVSWHLLLVRVNRLLVLIEFLLVVLFNAWGFPALFCQIIRVGVLD